MDVHDLGLRRLFIRGLAFELKKPSNRCIGYSWFAENEIFTVSEFNQSKESRR